MPELACKIDGCDYEGTPQGLRSHLHGRKDDDHVEAAADRRHHDWYPSAYGLDDEGTAVEGGDEGAESPSEGADPAPSEEGTGEGGGDTLDPDPSEGGPESPDEADEYAAQWEGADTPTETPSEGADPDPSEEGTDGEGDDTPDPDPAEESGMGLGTALVLGTGALAVAVLLRGRGSDPTESPDATNPTDTQNEGGSGGSGWDQSGGSTPIDGTDTDDMEFTPTET
ncbi:MULTISPECIES: hypothetical protein [Halorubrum]|uniref:Uncharacterized protein n=1 Tax=Halorubrum sodomense TaxID=35743 RepID=A0A1I6HYK3_HALSD|nr:MULTISPECIES: hypothetical protein [Halorubrum]TKX54479.1 hypothetical protein EXE42_08290 [Halorubrum sp. SP3]TKX70814.1 hypothetical protein EXE45_03275 [Halorubrum sp. SP9]SFR59523.1 hypothetical protein SAMN04487937_2981 [Halorubrum sodomense]